MIYIGTSGFSYDDWKGFFYPAKTDKKDMLSYYARRFRAVEINSTYYRIPGPRMFHAMVDKTPNDFRFVVKAHKDMTHTEDVVQSSVDQFLEAVRPLTESRKLGCILAQYPWGYKKTPENIDRLKALRDTMGGLPIVVELRNVEWVGDDTFELLRGLELGFCAVDEPRLRGLMPPVCAATSGIGYIRFHGRNAANWWKHEHSWQRYNYLYRPDELEEWVPKVEDLSRETQVTYLFFNNHYQGKSAENARMFAQMLNLPLPNVSPEQPSLL